MLEETFKSLAHHYQNDTQHAEKLWKELVMHYSDGKRHYHTLNHLHCLLIQILTYKDAITDLDAILFALYYHDAVYDVLRKDNEEKSAELAEERMRSLSVPREKIELSKQHIVATKAHTLTTNPDTNLFTDADLSILGANWDTYYTYSQQIRQEYSIYPDLLYKPGRKEVLRHFLEMARIFKTDYFFNAYENQARENIEKELSLL
jgi:predicted metal-dependent HD superfamily phosphohydrolase